MSESRSMAYLIEAEGLFKRSDRRMGARTRSDETLKAMNNHHAVVEEIRLRDLHPSEKDLSTSSCAGLSIDRIRGDGDATAWTQGLDLGTKRKSPHIINCEETRNNVLTKEVREREREAGAEGGI